MSEATEPELKQCPFCGGVQPGISRSRPILEELTEEAGGGWRVSCYGCGVGTWEGRHQTPEAAVAAWNLRRAEAAALAAARAEERAATAQLAEDWIAPCPARILEPVDAEDYLTIQRQAKEGIAAAIRARGETP